MVGEMYWAGGSVPSFISSPRDGYLYIALLVADTVLMFVSVKVGMALWGVRSGAVRAARKWLAVLALVRIPFIIIPLSPQVATLDPNLSFIVSVLCFRNALPGLLCLAWRDYLVNSRRVAATYAE
jgi:hypothetical protein